VATALVVCRGAEPTRGLPLELEPLEARVEGQVEVESPLLSVGDHVEARAHLIGDGRRHRIVQRLFEIVGAELVEVEPAELEPAWKGIAPDDGRPDRLLQHVHDSRRTLPDAGCIIAGHALASACLDR
jgi:hypothetical protein